jgi:divalent metal cation (Fe/Co/Zn/Cd) transporter
MEAANPALPATPPSLLRRGRRLEWFTLAWNSLEAVIATGAGGISGSPSLVGFGVDSIIENLSAVTLLWRLRDGEDRERERRALRVVGVSFLLLAAYVTWESARDLLQRHAPEVSYVGIAIAALSLIVMPLLARSKRRVAAQLTSRALQADSRQTSLCAYLSAILLGGLVLNALLGWWWADPVAGLLMAPIIVREGVGALRGEKCDDCC